MMEQMPPINPIVSVPLVPIQAIPEVAVLEDRMDRIVDY
jgi:hypothetical protein